MSDINIDNKPMEVTDALLQSWATEGTSPVALRLKQTLLPIEENRVIFPPTYADIGYNVDTLSDGTRVAMIDSVGSQANRLEPIFKTDSTDCTTWLVPQIDIVIRKEDCGECEACKQKAEHTEKKKKQPCKKPYEVKRSLLDLAHRAADAVVQASPTLQPIIEKAFRALRQRGDAGSLCEIAPTSLVFGVWDSRGASGEKRPRLVRSIIRAWDVEPLRAAAQFNSVWKTLDQEQREELQKEAKAKNVDLSEKGLADAPAVFRKTKAPQYRDGAPNADARVLGGVIAKGPIAREVTINLVALRGLYGSSESETNAIREYILGLSLVAATADIELFLREGCLLRYAENGDTWWAVPRRGEPKQLSIDAGQIQKYAKTKAEPFRPKWPKDVKHDFDLKKAKELLTKRTAEEVGSASRSQ